jgi:ribonuclease HI
MAKKEYYYTVWKGLQTGVFDKWEDCEGFVLGFSNAQHEKFSTYEEAKEALDIGYEEYQKRKKEHNDLVNQPLF